MSEKEKSKLPQTITEAGGFDVYFRAHGHDPDRIVQRMYPHLVDTKGAVMRECKDCKHWNNAMLGDWGECSRMRSDKDHHPVDGDTWAHSEGANGTVTTAPDFGCIMFQTKASLCWHCEGEGEVLTAQCNYCGGTGLAPQSTYENGDSSE
jgi:hypothetical protein